MSRAVVREAVYPHPPERVWRALTEPEAIARWLMENDFQPRVGHKFRFRTEPRPGFDGIVHCEVVEVDEPRRLAYTWAGGWLRKPTVVTWTLEPDGAGTRVRLEHSGFAGLGGLALKRILGPGWKRLLRTRLRDYLDREEQP